MMHLESVLMVRFSETLSLVYLIVVVVSVLCCQGDRGPKGVQGEKGAKGQEGPAGEQVKHLHSSSDGGRRTVTR